MRRIILVALSVAVVACAAAASPPDTPLGALEAARHRWSAAGLDSYRFIFEDDCGECLPSMSEPREVIVDAGSSGSPDDPTVEELFRTIEDALAAGSPVEVAYEAELGYPTEIWIDREARAYDGGTHWMVRDLTPDREAG